MWETAYTYYGDDFQIKVSDFIENSDWSFIQYTEDGWEQYRELELPKQFIIELAKKLEKE
jgi:hypothetical protein